MVMRGHAGANMVPVVAANRIGPGGERVCPMTFYGSSFIADHLGALAAAADRTAEKVLVAQLRSGAVSCVPAKLGLLPRSPAGPVWRPDDSRRRLRRVAGDGLTSSRAPRARCHPFIGWTLGLAALCRMLAACAKQTPAGGKDHDVDDPKVLNLYYVGRVLPGSPSFASSRLKPASRSTTRLSIRTM